MLRLESCLRGEVAETIKGLGYTQAAYDAAKARLQRNQRKVQAQIDDLRKLKPVIEGDPKSMDRFADTLEKTVAVLKDKSLHVELGGGTLPIWNCCREIACEFAEAVLSLGKRAGKGRNNGNSKRMGGRGSRSKT